MATVYGLADAEGRIRYVGQTRKKLSQRLAHHVCTARKGDPSRRARWIRSLTVPPSIVPLAHVADYERHEFEQFCIAEMRGKYDLLNEADGGLGTLGRRHSEETKAKISAAHRGKKVPREAIERMVRANLGRPLSAEHRAKVAAANARRVIKPETLEKMRARARTPELRQAMRIGREAWLARMRGG